MDESKLPAGQAAQSETQVIAPTQASVASPQNTPPATVVSNAQPEPAPAQPAPVPPPESPAEVKPADPSDSKPVPKATTPKSAPTARGPVIIIILAAVVVGVLAGVAYYAFTRSN